MSDLIYLLDQLVDLKGNIIINGINDDVLPLTDDERATYTDIDFDKVSREYWKDQMNLTWWIVKKCKKLYQPVAQRWWCLRFQIFQISIILQYLDIFELSNLQIYGKMWKWKKINIVKWNLT